jgi:hypothetical protein
LQISSWLLPIQQAEAAEAAKKEKKKKQKEAEKAKTNQQKQFIKSTKFDDVVVDETNPLKLEEAQMTPPFFSPSKLFLQHNCQFAPCDTSAPLTEQMGTKTNLPSHYVQPHHRSDET